MSVTPGLGAFNKDKVANRFGIQLKNKDTNKQSQQPSTEKIIINTDTSIVTKNKTVSDFRVQNQSNGFQSEPLKKTLENSIKSKSNIELISMPMHNERRDSLNSNVNHSTSLNPVKLNSQLSSKLSDTIKIPNLIPKDRSKSPSPSSIKQTNITERSVSPIPSSKQSTIPTTKTEAQIEHQKDQPLYKRQLSRTLDNTIILTSKTPILSNTR